MHCRLGKTIHNVYMVRKIELLDNYHFLIKYLDNIILSFTKISLNVIYLLDTLYSQLYFTCSL